ncbi:MAG: protein-ADP-ribose hydrolase [Eubacteriales bacterium]
MTQIEKLFLLNEILLDEMQEYKEQASEFSKDYDEQRRLLRSLMNVCKTMPLNKEFLKVQDDFLKEEVVKKGVVFVSDLRTIKSNEQIYLWQGDITTLGVDAIVNAANSALLGCFIPCHGCIDNAIHSVAGLQLRNDCGELIRQQGHEEETGKAKSTKAYNLPCKNVIHTVGPIIYGELTERDCDLLASCYMECLKLAEENNYESIALCCISTGEFRFPNGKAAEIAVKTVMKFININKSNIKVIFNVFKEKDYQIYRELLGE